MDSKIKDKNKINKVGVYLAGIWAIISLFAGLDGLTTGNINASIEPFIECALTLIGISLYLIRKKHNEKKYFIGSKIIETALITLIVLFLIISFTSSYQFWYESPLVWSVTPIIVLVSYFVTKFGANK